MDKPILLLLYLLIPLQSFAIEGDPKSRSHTKKMSHHYEVELSYTTTEHFEIKGAYFFDQNLKLQGMVETTGHCFAAMLVRELHFHKSRLGTFLGFGAGFDYDEKLLENKLNHQVIDNEHEHGSEWHTNLMLESGLAYALDSHWSTGFTVYPGYDIIDHKPNMGMTLDLVFAF
ncbi:hypothetical protein V6R21_16955 [Limibacter armeniacum]|uniref:hypothetical protein n=1 Tax=Limibacter armeniacum TaxID=466084 RepID=UPI002FE66314